LEITCILQNHTGLHARPATQLVTLARTFQTTEIFIRVGEKEVSSRSLLGVLGLGATGGTEIAIRAEGPQAEEALTALKALIESGFGE
jgi:phosphotransferase system HPr (HPr) family protein